MAQRVVVLSGGVAGLSAAHGLIERGFDVEDDQMGFEPRVLGHIPNVRGAVTGLPEQRHRVI